MTYPHPHHGGHPSQPKKRFALLWEYPNSAIVRHYGAATKTEIGALQAFCDKHGRKLFVLKMNKLGTGLLLKVYSESTVLSGQSLFIASSGRCPIVRVCIGNNATSTDYTISYVNVTCKISDIFDDDEPVGIIGSDRKSCLIGSSVTLDQLNQNMQYNLQPFHGNAPAEDQHITMPTLYMFGDSILPSIPRSGHLQFPTCLGIGAPVDPQIIPFSSKDRGHSGSYYQKRLPIATGGTVGLSNNNGIMCYVNSVTQCLAHTPLFKIFCTTNLFKDGMNKTNPLGTKCHLAQCFGALINKLWDPQYGTIPSLALWKAMGSFKYFFEEFQQQDAQEFLACLLDGLHEDYNEVNDRILVPKFEPSDQIPIEEVADECWKRYLLRNRSFIVGNCMGMLKSTLQCKTCGKGNLTFDPYMQLTLELPDSEPEQLVDWMYFPPDYPSAVPIQLQRIVQPFATMGDLKELTIKELSLTNITPADLCWCILIYRSDLSGTSAVTVNSFFPGADRDSQKVFYVNMEISSGSGSKRDSQRHWTIGLFASTPAPPTVYRRPVIVNSHENVATEGTLHPMIFLMEPTEMTTPALVNEIRRRTGIPDEQYKIAGAQWDECSRHGCSFCAAGNCSGCPIWPLPQRYQHDATMQYIPQSSSFGSDTSNIDRETARLQEQVHQFLRNNNMSIMPDVALGQQEDPDCVATVEEALSDYSEFMENVDIYSLTIGQLIDYITAERFSSFEREPSHYYDQQQQQVLAEYDCFQEVAPSLTGPIIVKLCWRSPRLTDKLNLNPLCESHDPVDLLYKDPSNHLHLAKQHQLEKRVYTLTECLELFTRVEKLGQGDMWKCTNCKKEEPSRKKFEIWSLPNLLFIHIKRFAARGDCSLRLRHHVSFPLEGLDLSDYMAKRGQSTKSGYNLASPTLEAKPNGVPPMLSIGGSNNFAALNPSGDTPTKGAQDSKLPKYKLTGVVTHHGPDIQYGHYTSHCLHENGTWYHFDDDTVTEKREEEVLNNLQKDVYLLCYSREDFTNDSWEYKTTWPDTTDVLNRVKEENRLEREKEKKEKEDREARKRVEKEETATQPEIKRQRPSSEVHPRQPQADLPVRHADPQIILPDNSFVGDGHSLAE